jgi:glycosyltransferase involved in cell wall biosynthesis
MARYWPLRRCPIVCGKVIPVPAVSVIMPCYNAERFLPTSVGSVLAQTFTDWELIAVDDGSTDGTARWLSNVKDHRVRVVRQPNRGLPGARNTGIRNATGRFLAFLDADDSLDAEFLQEMVSALSQNFGAGIAYCGWQNLGLAGGRGEPFIPPEYEGDNKIVSLLTGCRWPVHAALVRRDVAFAAKGFDEAQQAAEDFDFWLRTATASPIVRVPRVLAFYHHHGEGQMSANRARMARFQLRAQRKFIYEHPDLVRKLGRRRIRKMLWDPVLKMGYAAYWARNLVDARAIFREVMKHGYGSIRDWCYMLPSLLPTRLYEALVRWRDRRRQINIEGTS